MAMNAIIQKHSNSVSPVVTPTTKAIKPLCISSIGSSSGAAMIQSSYITVNPSGAAAGALPLIAQGVPGGAQVIPGGAQVIQGTPIAMSQLGELGATSVVQLAPIGYTNAAHGSEAGLLQAQT